MDFQTICQPFCCRCVRRRRWRSYRRLLACSSSSERSSRSLAKGEFGSTLAFCCGGRRRSRPRHIIIFGPLATFFVASRAELGRSGLLWRTRRGSRRQCGRCDWSSGPESLRRSGPFASWLFAFPLASGRSPAMIGPPDNDDVGIVCRFARLRLTFAERRLARRRLRCRGAVRADLRGRERPYPLRRVGRLSNGVRALGSRRPQSRASGGLPRDRVSALPGPASRVGVSLRSRPLRVRKALGPQPPRRGSVSGAAKTASAGPPLHSPLAATLARPRSAPHSSAGSGDALCVPLRWPLGSEKVRSFHFDRPKSHGTQNRSEWLA